MSYTKWYLDILLIYQNRYVGVLGMNYWLLSLTFIAVNLDFFLSANLTSIFRKRRGHGWLLYKI